MSSQGPKDDAGATRQRHEELRESLEGAIAAYLRSCLQKAFGPKPGVKGHKLIEQATLAALEDLKEQPTARQRAKGFNKASYMERFMATPLRRA